MIVGRGGAGRGGAGGGGGGGGAGSGRLWGKPICTEALFENNNITIYLQIGDSV